MFIPILLFILGLLLLIKGGDWFVDGASGIAHTLRVPEFLIGATVVSIGTTLPEVMVSATSALSGHGEIAYGNAIGSVICNTALICALTMAIRPCDINRKELKIPVLFFFTAAEVYSVFAYCFGKFDRTSGIILLGLFVIYMVFTVIQAKKIPDTGHSKKTQERMQFSIKDVLGLIVGAVAIAVGADLLVDNGTILAKMMGVPESVIALSFIALGTSLPELVTAITALAKGHGALSLGNIIGANFFNLVFVSGLSIALSPFSLPAAKTIFGINSSLVVDIPVMFLVMALMTLPALLRGKLSRFQGVLLLAIYSVFCAFQFAF